MEWSMPYNGSIIHATSTDVSWTPITQRPVADLLLDGLDDLDLEIRTFAQTCLDAKENCTLNTPPAGYKGKFKFTSADALLSAIDEALDAVYLSPIAVSSLPDPGTALAVPTVLRTLVFFHVFIISLWPSLSDQLSKILYQGNWADAIAFKRYSVNPSATNVSESGRFARGLILVCLSCQRRTTFCHTAGCTGINTCLPVYAVQ
jgi:hypothetical protein